MKIICVKRVAVMINVGNTCFKELLEHNQVFM